MEATVGYTNGDPRQTGVLMRRMVDKYWTDMVPYAHLSFREVFDRIKRVPFKPDPVDVETLQRPQYTMAGTGFGGDCDDKAIALAAWCKATGYPYRFVAVRRPGRSELHHVYCEVQINGQWIHADPTYPFNTEGRPRERYEEYVYM